MKRLAVVAVVGLQLSGCAWFRANIGTPNEAVRCVWTVGLAPPGAGGGLALSGCEVESWNGTDPVIVKPCTTIVTPAAADAGT